MLMSEWKEYKFSDFAIINPTVSLKGALEYSFVEMKDLQDGNKFCFPSAKRKTSSGARFHEKDTLFARITPCLENGKICQVRGLENKIGFGSTEFLVFRGKKNISENDFVFYLSRWEEVRRFAESNFEGTSGRQRVNKNCFNNLFLKLPDYKEQIQIASILSSLDDKIDLLHRQNKTLEQLAETLFRQWFVEEAEESWEVGTVEDLFKLQRGFDLPSQNRVEGQHPIITSSGSNGTHNEYKIKGPGVTTGRSGLLGNVFYIDEDFWPLNTSLFIVEYKIASPLFAYFFLKTLDIMALNGGSAVPTLNRNDVHQLETQLPPTDLVGKFEINAKTYFQKIKSNTTQIHTLTQLRDTLLPTLMSGEVRVI